MKGNEQSSNNLSIRKWKKGQSRREIKVGQEDSDRMERNGSGK